MTVKLRKRNIADEAIFMRTVPMSNSKEIVITADAHVGETESLRQRLPEQFRDSLPAFGVDQAGNLDFKFKGKSFPKRHQHEPTEEDMLREFRTDPSQGTDLDRRLHDMALEGVDAQVIFPNIGLGMSMGTDTSAYYEAWARAYNDYVWEIFAPQSKRMKPAAMLSMDNVDEAVKEAERCIKRGFCTLFVPAVMPWQPYHLPVYEPLWSLADEAGIPVNFHIFSGNCALGGGFASITDMSAKRFEKAKRIEKEENAHGSEEHLDTVLGLAVGMSPIIELTSGGVLERHPNLEMVVTESECGWLAWLLQSMDQIQKRRFHNMRKLELRASEYFLRQGTITISDDAVALNNIGFTGTECLMWGNDYPHDEGTFPFSRRPIEEIKSRLDDEAARHVLCGNAARLFGFDLDYLAANQEEVTGHAH